ncbi:putative quinol monooxygenase [Amycolatopsis thermoflava]|uniref:putative quinol monooxygenase n=1 Tax=Amycolatopsis thermoflava TaxID=84480 RepID=UPI003EB6D060
MAYVVVATWKAKPGQAEHIRKVLETVTPINRAEEKMLHFQAQVSIDDPDTFVVYEKYVDASGYADHKASDAFQSYVVGEVIPNLVERSVATFETID